MSAPRLVMDLARAGELGRGIVGGKAGTLGVLAAAGFPVPPGFVVTSAAADQAGEDLHAAVDQAADRLGPGPFAVRSSASAEDRPDASYAGLYETYLDVDRPGLDDAIVRCLASATAERVAAYHAERDADNAGDAGQPRNSDGVRGMGGMAVLVQQMVDAAAAGVAFTANPVTGHREEIVVTAARGLGERLVSGEATGEEWTVRHGRAELTRSGEEGPALAESQATAVAGLAARVAGRFGVPQDIEWAIDHRRRLYLLQARPMTALPDPVAWAAPGPGLWVRNFRLGEWLPEAMTPLFANWLLHRIEAGYLAGMRATVKAVVPFRYASINGWYYNAAPIPTPWLLARVILQSRGRAPWFLFNALARVSRNPVAADRAVLADLERQWREQVLPGYRHLVEVAERDVDTAAPRRLAEIVDQVGLAAGEYLWYLAIVGGSAWKMEGCLARFCRDRLAVSALAEDPQVLLRGLPGTEPALPAHAVHSVDWYWPTAGETPDGPAGPHATPPAGRQARLAATRTEAERVCRDALEDRPRLRRRFDGLLGVAQRYAVIREEQARELTLGWPLLRRCVRRLGGHLQTVGVIAAADDVFFLTYDELTAALGGSPSSPTDTPRRRRAVWDRQRRLAAPLALGTPPRLVGDPIARAVDAARGDRNVAEGAIVGQPASAGRATGRVRIVAGPDDFAGFVDGEVLVAKATAPAWTPLFAQAAAVVTDGGTLAAHASLVAREYGIPAVVGTGHATTRLRNGQVVTVDGGAGTVQPHDHDDGTG